MTNSTTFNPGPGTKRHYTITEVRTVEVTASCWAESPEEALDRFDNGTASGFDTKIISTEDAKVIVDLKRGFR